MPEHSSMRLGVTCLGLALLACSARIGVRAHPDGGRDSADRDSYLFPDAGVLPKSCADAHAQGVTTDGVLSIAPDEWHVMDVYCDMTTDGGGWTLVARVLGTSTTHVTSGAIGSLVAPGQATTAKLDDAMINIVGFTHARLIIPTIGNLYVTASSLDLSGAAFNTNNAAAAALAGPYNYPFGTETSCTSDCGVAQSTVSPLG